MKLFTISLMLFSFNAMADAREHILGNIYADCYGREATAEEMEQGKALTPQEIIAMAKSEACQSEEAKARRAERREERIAAFKEKMGDRIPASLPQFESSESAETSADR